MIKQIQSEQENNQGKQDHAQVYKSSTTKLSKLFKKTDYLICFHLGS
jgi:hypothetical protein